MPKIPSRLRFLFLFGMMTGALYGQSSRRYVIAPAAGPIVVDGRLDEAAWQAAEPTNHFYQHFPEDSIPARWQTEVRMTFNRKFLYVGVFCRDSSAGGYVIESLKRDFSFRTNDGFSVTLDPTEDKTTGFNFTVSPYGVQREGLLSFGGTFGVSTSWDAPWYAETHRTDSGWYAEMAIPFKVLRYFPERKTWGLNFARQHLKAYERSVWSPVPRNYNVTTLLFAGTLEWTAPPPRPGLNFAFNPYVAGKLTYTESRRPELKTGFDGKLALTPSMTADFTVYPDFSHVDVDQQVIDLERFSIFFPEKRSFFLENNDLFSWVGFMRIRPFFSRRIGLYRGQIVPIIYGLRISGKATPRLRVGLLNAQTEGRADWQLAPNNHTVVAAQYRVGAASSLSFIGVNRQSFDAAHPVDTDYNRVGGLDYQFASSNGKIRGKAFLHTSYSPFESPRQGWAHGLWIMYKTERLTAHWNHEWVSPTYRAELGFVPRHDYYRLEPEISYRFYLKKSKWLYYHGPEIYWSSYWSTTGQKTDDRVRIAYEWEFVNTTEVTLYADQSYVLLTFPFDPTEAGNPPLPANRGYLYRSAGLEAASDKRKTWQIAAEARYGQYFSGMMTSGQLRMQYQWRPYFNTNVGYTFVNIQMPYLNQPVVHQLLQTTAQLTLSRKVFWTLIAQYNTQARNFNLYSRLQYRYLPLSDIFLVINHNFPLSANAAAMPSWITFKVNYWLQP